MASYTNVENPFQRQGSHLGGGRYSIHITFVSFCNFILFIFLILALRPGEWGTRLGGLHPGSPLDTALPEQRAVRALPPDSVSVDAGRSRTRAGSLLPGAHVPH